jgi:long-chain acyl-CoA synthetase
MGGEGVTGLPDMAAEALRRPADQLAIEQDGRWHDWGLLRRIADEVAGALDASGVGPTDPIAFVPRNRPSSVAALLALLASGRTIRMIYAFQSADGIARDIAKLGCGAAILDAQDVSEAVIATLGEAGIAGIALAADAAAPIPGHELWRGAAITPGPAEPQIEILTSGTTGPPKQFALPYAVVERHFIGGGPFALTGAATPDATPPGLLFFPIGNISGIYSTVPPLIRGQRVVLLERFSLAAWHGYVVRHRPSHSGIPPSSLQELLDADIPREDLASIRVMGMGAAPVDPTVHRAFEARYGIPILLSYGATEFAGPVTAMTLDLHREWGEAKFGSVGRAMPGARLRIVDPDSRAELPPGGEGLLEVISPRLAEDWIRTSDLGMIDADGFLFLRGRADGAIMRGGFKIIPESVERALMEHVAVGEAAVVGVADRRLGQVPAAAIRLKPNVEAPDPAALEAHLRARLLAPHIPAQWRFCESLPRTPSHKIDRPAVRALFEEKG